MKLLIIQPGRLGDILICLPIAKFYSTDYEIVWPVMSEYMNTFENVDYVTPVPISGSISNSLSCVYGMEGDFDLVLDLSFGFNGSRVQKYHSDLDFASNFVEAKYKLAKVPIEERWNLVYNRNIEKEKTLFDIVVKKNPYSIVHDTGSCGKLITMNPDFVRVMPIDGYNIFDWYKVALDSENIYCIDSSFCNFVESVSDFKDKNKFYIPAKNTGGVWGMTTLKNNWSIIK